MPPSLADWMIIPRFSITILNAFWPYASLPVNFILGIGLLRSIINTIRELGTPKTQG